MDSPDDRPGGRMMRLGIAVALATGLLAGCDRDPDGPDTGGLEVAEVVLEASDGDVIYSHNDHWHGVLRVRPDSSETVGLFFVATPNGADNHDAPEPARWFSLLDHPDAELRATVEDTAIARWNGTETEGTLTGRAVGATHITFVVLHDGTTVYQSPPLGISVSAPPVSRITRSKE